MKRRASCSPLGLPDKLPRMTYRNREENLVSSEACYYYHTGSVIFANPQALDHWNPSVSSGESSHPSSPDSFLTDHTFSDCQDLSVHDSSQTSSPLNWSSEPAMDNSTYVHTAEDDWGPSGFSVTSQAMQNSDAAAWQTFPSGFVDLGLSPVLSHETQSTHTLTSVSEPDPYILPPSFGHSFCFEPGLQGPVVYDSSAFPSQTIPELCYPDQYNQDGHAASCPPSAPVAFYPGTLPDFYPQGGQATYPQGRSFPQAHATPGRLLLPRTESVAVPSQPAYGSQRILRPSVPVPRGSIPSAESVSNTAGLPQDMDAATNLPVVANSALPSSMSTGPSMSVPSVADPTAEAFRNFIRFDQEDQQAVDAVLHQSFEAAASESSYLLPEYKAVPLEFHGMPEEAKSVFHASEPDVDSTVESKPEQDPASSMATRQSSESDEGRHRSHHYYSVQPHLDGLYHCPNYKPKDSSSCGHMPTKLKCNYDKYIDSHLKPFRCKNEACINQSFSSTACLLRHEREAHGMHGHGDRPHLCYYSGCERGIPGNGFPRRYNLFDHMKRVHDHKEDAVDSTGSPILGGDAPKTIRGTKRKASSDADQEQPAQRKKVMTLPEQTPLIIPETQDGYYYPNGFFQ